MRLMDIFRKKPAKTIDEKLDEALEDTFPASDPPSMTDPSIRVGRRRPTKTEVTSRTSQ